MGLFHPHAAGRRIEAVRARLPAEVVGLRRNADIKLFRAWILGAGLRCCHGLYFLLWGYEEEIAFL